MKNEHSPFAIFREGQIDWSFFFAEQSGAQLIPERLGVQEPTTEII